MSDSLQIIDEYPPNYKKISAIFDLNGIKPVFTYGRVIYNPHKSDIQNDVIVHERVHIRQQSSDQMNPDKWWEMYITDVKFRLEQEIEAYRAQYAYVCENIKDKNSRFRMLHSYAQNLASKMYGHIISYTDAIIRIKK